MQTYHLLENYSPTYIIYSDINMTDSRHMCFDTGFRWKGTVFIYEIVQHVHSKQRCVEQVYNLLDGRGHVTYRKFKAQIPYALLH